MILPLSPRTGGEGAWALIVRTEASSGDSCGLPRLSASHLKNDDLGSATIDRTPFRKLQAGSSLGKGGWMTSAFSPPKGLYLPYYDKFSSKTVYCCLILNFSKI